MPARAPATLRNFGRNLSFSPRHRSSPADEDELLALLARHARGRLRATGSLHSWSDVAVSDDASVSLHAFDRVLVERDASGAPGRTVRVGAGCTIDRLLRELRAQGGAALPTVGAITRQTIAGAIATGTHGSGAASVSDLVESLRVAAYDPGDGRPRLYEWSGGDALHAARCGIGCTGIVTEVRLRCEPLWNVEERFVARDTLAQVLHDEARYPLQMFLMLPYAWSFLVYQRRRAPPDARISRGVLLYRAYNRAWVDFTVHAALRLLTLRTGGRRRALRALLRTALPSAFVRGWRVVDRYDRLLTLAHEWFRHEEMELAVSARHVHDAAAIVRDVITRLADRGSYTHHYPILFRRVLPDRALLAVTGDAVEPRYALSVFSYHPAGRRDGFRAFAATLARELAHACGARPHWGKFFPLVAADIEQLYGADRLARFRAFCASIDPHGVFRNDFTRRVLRL